MSAVPFLSVDRDLDFEAVPLADAVLCLGCDLIYSFRLHHACPSCGETSVFPIARALDKKAKRVRRK